MTENRSDLDDWAPGTHVLNPQRISSLKAVLESTPVILEHWFYRGSRAPARLIFDDYDDLHGYVATRTTPGDSLWVWRWDSACRDDNSILTGKVPNANGVAPKRGAY